jgi:hypothetical protein
MIICDENIDVEQVHLLRSWHFKVQKIGVDISRSGIDDSQILPLLHLLKYPTFVTWDAGFYRRELTHPKYCIIYLETPQHTIAKTIKRLISRSEFSTRSSRMGKVIHVAATSIRFWQFKVQQEHRIDW